MRGKILVYNGSDGSGVIAANGQQYPFGITAWKGETAPAVGKTVEIVVNDGAVNAVMLVRDDVLLAEKAAELRGKLGGIVGSLGATASANTAGSATASPQISADAASALGASILSRYGKGLLVAFALWVLGTTMFNFIAMSMFGASQGAPLFDLAKLMSAIGGGGSLKGLLILSYLGGIAPVVWKDRRAWLGLLLPAAVLLFSFISVASKLDGLGGGPLGDASDLFSFGLGFYLSIGSALYLAFGGFKRFAGR